VNEVFEFVEQLLRTADAERWDDDSAAVFQGVFDGGLEAFLAGGAVFVDAIAVGAFEDEDVRALGGFWRWE
jgi:hypothetical protein